VLAAVAGAEATIRRSSSTFVLCGAVATGAAGVGVSGVDRVAGSGAGDASARVGAGFLLVSGFALVAGFVPAAGLGAGFVSRAGLDATAGLGATASEPPTAARATSGVGRAGTFTIRACGGRFDESLSRSDDAGAEAGGAETGVARRPR
jgi:hypothetical protein